MHFITFIFTNTSDNNEIMNTDNQSKRTMTEAKPCYVLASASDIFIMYSKKIHSCVGAMKLYLLTKDMKLDNSEVGTIKFIGNVSA